MRKILVEKIVDPEICCLSDNPSEMIEKTFKYCKLEIDFNFKKKDNSTKKAQHINHKKYYLLNEEQINKLIIFQRNLLLMIDIYELILNKRIPYKMSDLFDEHSILDYYETEFINKYNSINTNCPSYVLIRTLQENRDKKILVIVDTPFHVKLLADVLIILFSNKFGYKTLNIIKSVLNEKITIVDKSYSIDYSNYNMIIGKEIEGKICKIINYSNSGLNCGSNLNKDSSLEIIPIELLEKQNKKTTNYFTLSELIENPMKNLYEKRKNIITYTPDEKELLTTLTFTKKIFCLNFYGVDDLL